MKQVTVNHQTKQIVIQGKQVSLSQTAKSMLFKFENIGYSVVIAVK